MEEENREIRIELLVPFKAYSGQTYEGERLQQMMDSIRRSGLITPIIVRPVDGGKYEIICGHNRVKAMEALGYDVIKADIKYELTDEQAIELYFDSNLNQQSFSDWNYMQKIEAVKYIERVIKKSSQQGKRNDLERKKGKGTEETTCVQTRQKLEENKRREVTRDKMARSLSISTATLSKYRRIIKLPDRLLNSIVRLLDEKKISFEAAYIISNVIDMDIEYLIKIIDNNPGCKLDLKILKTLPSRKTAAADNDIIYPHTSARAMKAVILQDSDI